MPGNSQLIIDCAYNLDKILIFMDTFETVNFGLELHDFFMIS